MVVLKEQLKALGWWTVAGTVVMSPFLAFGYFLAQENIAKDDQRQAEYEAWNAKTEIIMPTEYKDRFRVNLISGDRENIKAGVIFEVTAFGNNSADRQDEQMTAEEAIEKGILEVKLPEGTEVRPVYNTVVDGNEVIDYTVEPASTYVAETKS